MLFQHAGPASTLRIKCCHHLCSCTPTADCNKRRKPNEICNFDKSSQVKSVLLYSPISQIATCLKGIYNLYTQPSLLDPSKKPLTEKKWKKPQEEQQRRDSSPRTERHGLNRVRLSDGSNSKRNVLYQFSQGASNHHLYGELHKNLWKQLDVTLNSYQRRVVFHWYMKDISGSKATSKLIFCLQKERRSISESFAVQVVWKAGERIQWWAS